MTTTDGPNAKDMQALYKSVKKRSNEERIRLHEEVDNLIKNKETSDYRITNALERLLDLIKMGYSPKDFKLLVKYYAGFEQSNARKYYAKYKKLIAERGE